MTVLPLREADGTALEYIFIESRYDIPVKITIFGEFPETADVSAESVDTRVVVPPAPPVVLYEAISGLYDRI
jgi:hypothetical protein